MPHRLKLLMAAAVLTLASRSGASVPPEEPSAVYRYTERPEAAEVKSAAGSVAWRLEESREGPAVIAEITIPDQGIGIRLALSRNRGASLPATHLLAIDITGAPDAPLPVAIAEIDGLTLKPAADDRGDALAGATVKVGDNRFLMALSAADAAVNLRLLQSAGWWQLSLRFADGREAAVVLPRGESGGLALEAALAARADRAERDRAGLR